MQMLLSIIWLEMETICSQNTALEEMFGATKIQVEDHLSGHKDMLLKTGLLQAKDLGWSYLQFPMDLTISTVPVL